MIFKKYEVYIDGGLVPDEIFMLQVEGEDLCLTYNKGPGQASGGYGDASLSACDTENDRQYWNVANQYKSIRAWNTDQVNNFILKASPYLI